MTYNVTIVETITHERVVEASSKAHALLIRDVIQRELQDKSTLVEKMRVVDIVTVENTSTIETLV